MQPALSLVAALVEFEVHVFQRLLITICSKIYFEPSIPKKQKDKHKLTLFLVNYVKKKKKNLGLDTDMINTFLVN